MRLQAILSTLAVASLEVVLVLTAARLLYAVIARALARATAGRHGAAFADSSRALRLRARNLLIAACLLSTVSILAYNAWLAMRGVDAWTDTGNVLAGIGGDTWFRAGFALAKLVAAVLLFLVAVRLVRKGLRRLEGTVTTWHHLRDHDKSVRRAFTDLTHAVVTAGWLLLGIFAVRLFAVPASFTGGLAMLVRAYLVIAIGFLLIRSSVVIVDALDGLGQGFVQNREWARHYAHLRPLVPTFRACLEYALWIAVASLALLQVGWMGSATSWAPRLIQAIGLFFLGRVVIELGHLEIGRRMLPEGGLDEMARRRRETMAPVVRNAFTYAVYFGTAVLILASLGFNPMPFLAGAGILGLVVGFGAQSLIHDLVSGFFILFENTYLVGDAVEVAAAKGVVEAIEFRTTKIRDADGRLHIIRNGDVKQVVNYSKEYALAVVPVEVAYDVDLPQVFAILREAGERARRENADVLGETRIDGISAFGLATMTVRTSTQVKPGRHESAAASLRLAIKEAFDRRSAGAPRRALVPEKLVSGSPQRPDVVAGRR